MISQIRPNLYLSSYADVTAENIAKFNITTILNVAPELQNLRFANVSNVHVGFPDVVEGVGRVDEVAAAKLQRLLSEGKTVLVHCKAGASRSPHVVALCLSAIEGKDYNAVYEEVKKLHGRTIAYSMQQEMVDKGLRK